MNIPLVIFFAYPIVLMVGIALAVSAIVDRDYLAEIKRRHSK